MGHMAEHKFQVHNGSSDELDELNEHVHEPGDPDGLVAAEERSRYQQSLAAPQTAYKPKKLWPRVLITIVVLVVAGFGSYWFGNHEASKGTAKKATTSTQQKQAAEAAPITKEYDSTNYTLSFSYPTTWTVTDNTTKLTVVSPAMRLTTATGSKADAHIVVTMQNQQSTIPGFPTTGAIASLASDHLTYTQPSTVQRAQTYLSFLSYGTANELDALYVTGDNGYQQEQQVPMSDIIEGDPLISVNFESCTTADCSDGKAITLRASDWASTSENRQVISLIQSIILQG